MTVSFSLTHRKTGEFRNLPVSCSQPFRDIWMPAASTLGLELIPCLADGSLTIVPDEFIPRIKNELKQLWHFFVDQPTSESGWIIERIDGVLRAFDSMDPTDWQYSFG